MKKLGFIGKYCIGLGVVAAATITALASFSVAWFSNGDIQDEMIGRTARGYFGGGDGSATIDEEAGTAGPYQIHDPIHLYNLAWLQYIGYFKSADGNNTPVQKYFVLTQDIDMTGWALPPIGTEEYPFYGNFNGQGHKVTGLTVSNSWSDIQSRHPDSVNESTFTANIVGFFGVVGPYKNAATPASYSSAANAIQNTGLEGITVKSSASKTLVGLAAGYVNGPLEGVAVNNSYIDLRDAGTYLDANLTENISDYSLIGHAADSKYLSKMQSSITKTDTPIVENPFVSQGGDEWGGSIDMKTMYTNLLTKMKNSTGFSETITTYEEESRTKNADGSYTPSSGYEAIPSAKVTDNYQDLGVTHNNGNDYFYAYSDTGKKKDGTTDVQTANYTFVSSEDNSNKGMDGYVGLGGKYSLYDYSYTKEFITRSNESGFYYSDVSTGYYLSANESGLTYAKTKSNATPWFFDEEGHLYTNFDRSIRFLNLNSSTLSLANAGSTVWGWDSNTSTWTSGDYHLIFDGNQWLASAETEISVPSYYTIKQGARYLTNNGTNLSTTTAAASAGHLYFDDGAYGYAYFLYNNNKYYFDDSGYTTKMVLSSNATLSNCFLRQQSAPNYLYCAGYGDYMSIEASSISFTRSPSTTIDTVYTEQAVKCQTETINSEIIIKDAENKEDRHVYTGETYFPLTWKEGGTVTPSERNTGYVIGGSNYTNSSVGSIGDVRVAGDGAYETNTALKNSFISGSSYSSADFAPYTFNSSGTAVKIGDPINKMQASSGYSDYDSVLGLKKYYQSIMGKTTGSRLSLDSMVSGGTAYGLHFMNAEISMNNLITVPYAVINNEEHYNYQLPRDSIDFNLKTDGYINFFAHTGFVNPTWNNTNNSFFSLHWIDRSGSIINEIKQIAKIYKNKDYETDSSQPQYVYTFRNSLGAEVDTRWSTGVMNENQSGYIGGTKGDMVFDTYWLTDPQYNQFEVYAAYYFEIPVNKGEFALGSASGKTKKDNGWPAEYNKNGAYLMYLDIGASKKNDTGITVTEHSVTTTYDYSYPKGVDFKVLPTEKGDSFFEGVTGGQSSAIILDSNDSMNVGFKYTDDSDNPTLSVGKDNGGGGSFEAAYKTTGTSVRNTAGEDIPLDSGSPGTVDEMNRVTVYDLTKSENNYKTTTKHTIDGVEQAETVETQTKSWTEEQIGAIAAFEKEGENIFTVAYTASTGSEGSAKVILESTYDALTCTYTLNFVTEGTETQQVDLKFTTLNLTQSYVDDYDQTHSFTYHVVVQNNGVATGASLGDISTSSLNNTLSVISALKA